jgi:hypothetical protein
MRRLLISHDRCLQVQRVAHQQAFEEFEFAAKAVLDLYCQITRPVTNKTTIRIRFKFIETKVWEDTRNRGFDASTFRRILWLLKISPT